MSRPERPDDWEWTDDEHLAIWTAECLCDPRLRTLIYALRDPVAWGRAIRALGYPITGQMPLERNTGPLTWPAPYDWEQDPDSGMHDGPW